jgi:uncharacterized protein YndB with AHSA1/START domain
MPNTVKLQRVFRAPAERVFRAFIVHPLWERTGAQFWGHFFGAGPW